MTTPNQPPSSGTEPTPPPPPPPPSFEPYHAPPKDAGNTKRTTWIIVGVAGGLGLLLLLAFGGFMYWMFRSLPGSGFSSAGLTITPEWSHAGGYHSVATDDSLDRIYATEADDLVIFDDSGTETARHSLAIVPTRIILAEFSAGASPTLVVTDGADLVEAYDDKGNLLWSFTAAGQVTDVAAGDLDTDGQDELVISSRAGVQVLDALGSVKWKELGTPFVDALCADLDFDGTVDVVALSDTGKLHSWDATGAPQVILPMRDTDILVGGGAYGYGPTTGMGIAADYSGDLVFKASDLEIGASSYQRENRPDKSLARGKLISSQPSPSGQSVAVGQETGDVWIVPTWSGYQAYHVHTGGRAEVAWLERSSGEVLLLVTDGAGIHAYLVQ